MDKEITWRGLLFSITFSLLGFGLGVYHAVTDIPIGCRSGGLSTCGDGRTSGIALMLVTGTYLTIGVYRCWQLAHKESKGKGSD